jgi:hypothetical protein
MMFSFPDLETAEAAFELFDKDGNGDATRDEIESAILVMHRERLSLEASMRDLDGAVRRWVPSSSSHTPHYGMGEIAVLMLLS